MPRSTSHSNIWYHLALAHYLRDELHDARRAWRAALEFSANDDMQVASRHWLYMTLRRLGSEDEAATLLDPIVESMEIIENHDYHELLLMYRGERDPETLLARAMGGNGVGRATLAYGVANWHHYHGRVGRAEEIDRRILEGDQWAAFGFIAAEADLVRLCGIP